MKYFPHFAVIDLVGLNELYTFWMELSCALLYRSLAAECPNLEDLFINAAFNTCKAVLKGLEGANLSTVSDGYLRTIFLRVVNGRCRPR